jgi:hypothetical protein
MKKTLIEILGFAIAIIALILLLSFTATLFKAVWNFTRFIWDI